ncbi:hypothetical protein [Paraburkholderia sp. CNPSo 3272]|uniref:phage integrase central domain-containing protein n=1 Tax=Paraburkholderia sp. CNPSo 3272 TaxID=2940931 RepID=UPI0035CD2858
MRRIEKRGAVDTAHRSLQKCGQIFRYAVVTGRAYRDPTTDLREALRPAPKQHYASIKDPKEVGALARTIREYQGSFRNEMRAAGACRRPAEVAHCKPAEVAVLRRESEIQRRRPGLAHTRHLRTCIECTPGHSEFEGWWRRAVLCRRQSCCHRASPYLHRLPRHGGR